MLQHQGKVVQGDFSDVAITAGDTLIVHGLWDRIRDLGEGADFVLITSSEFEATDHSKTRAAVLCFALSIALGLSGFSASTAFLTGAVAMVLAGVLSMDEAYHAIDWQVVFFLAGLMPLGIAMQKTGAASVLAEPLLGAVGGSHPLVLLVAIAIASSLASLLLGNVAGTLILAPLVLSMAGLGGHDPRPLTLMVAVGAANSFILPTHQVNALLKTRGGYQNADYLRAGSGLTAIFVLVAVCVFYLLYL
jgi:di/tricarboxylate transporter